MYFSFHVILITNFNNYYFLLNKCLHFFEVDIAALQFARPSLSVLNLTSNFFINPLITPPPYFLFCTVYSVRRSCIAVCWSLNISVFNFLTFYFTLYICVRRDCIAVVGRSISVFFLTI